MFGKQLAFSIDARTGFHQNILVIFNVKNTPIDRSMHLRSLAGASKEATASFRAGGVRAKPPNNLDVSNANEFSMDP